MRDDVVAVLLAAGVGSRVGHRTPKQFLDLAGKPVLARTVANLAWCTRVVLVHHPDHLDRTREVVSAQIEPRRLALVPGGLTRRESLGAALAALTDLPDDVAVVLQNAASPNTPVELVHRCLDRLDAYDVVQAFVAAEHTVFRHEAGELAQVLPRAALGYTVDPTVYRLGCLRRITAAQQEQGAAGEMTLDTARDLGVAVGLVPSPAGNVKLTTGADLVLLRALLEAEGQAGPAPT